MKSSTPALATASGGRSISSSSRSWSPPAAAAILVLASNEGVRVILSALSTRENLQAVFTDSAEETIAAIDSTPWELVFLDADTHPSDSVAVLRFLDRERREALSRVIVLTVASPEEAALSEFATCRRLRKPIDVRDAGTALRECRESN